MSSAKFLTDPHPILASPPQSHYSISNIHYSLALSPSLRRSPLLWLGLFGLVFLLTAAVDSIRTVSRIDYHRDGSVLWGVSSSGLCMRMHRLDLKTTTYQATTWKDFGYRYAVPAGSTCHLFQQPRWETRSNAHEHLEMLHLPHWLIILSYLLLWGSLLAWRWRRRVRSARATAAPVATGE